MLFLHDSLNQALVEFITINNCDPSFANTYESKALTVKLLIEINYQLTLIMLYLLPSG